MAKKTLILTIGIILILLILGGIIGGIFLMPDVTQSALGENAKLYYPRMRAICCEEQTANAWKDVKTLSSNNIETYYTCPSQTSQCRFGGKPVVECDWWETYTWRIRLYNSDNLMIQEWYRGVFGIIGNDFGSSQPEFNPGDRVEYRAVCVSAVPPLLTIFDIFSKGNAPNSNNLNIENILTVLKYYNTQGVPAGTIPNTNYCNKAGINLNEENREPKSGFDSAVEKVKDFMKDENEDIGFEGQTKYIYLKNTPDQIFPGECSLSIGEWDELPFDYNVNSLGQYKGKDVMCELSMGLLKVEKIKTVGETSYYAPTTRYDTPNKFCCNHQDCKYLGTEYNCAYGKYTCEKTEGYCKSDLDCQPESGILQDKNCYMDKNGNFFLWDSQCINNKCSSNDMILVECCSSYCEVFGQICDYSKGCVKVIPPDQPCPPGSCCKKENLYKYIPKECGGELKCCDVNDGIGTCKIRCEPSPVCGCWIEFPRIPVVTEGGCILPDLICHIKLWIFKFQLAFSTVMGIIAGLVTLLIGFKLIPKKLKNKEIMIGIASIIFAITIGIVSWFFFWEILALIILLSIVGIIIAIVT